MKPRTPTTKLPDLSRTEAAIARYDELDRSWRVDVVERLPNQEAQKRLDELVAADEAVGIAFGLDTADRNDPETCKRHVRAGPAVPSPGAELSFVRQMVARWKAERA